MQARARVCRNGYDAPSWAIVSGSGGARRPPLLDAARNPSQLLLVQSPYGRRGATSPPLPLRLPLPWAARPARRQPVRLRHLRRSPMLAPELSCTAFWPTCDVAPSRLALDATIVSLLTRRASFFSPWQCPEEIREAIRKTDSMRRTSHSQERAAARKLEQMRIYVHAYECVCVCVLDPSVFHFHTSLSMSTSQYIYTCAPVIPATNTCLWGGCACTRRVIVRS